MNSNIQVFTYGANTVRTIEKDGTAWFVAKDVADILGFRDAFNATMHLDDDEKDTTKVSTPGGEQDMTIISESGLYTLIMRSNKPEAKQFRKWVTGTVLPMIREKGYYAPEDFNVVPVKNEQQQNKPKIIGQFTNSVFKSAMAIIEKAQACKKDEDFEAVLALDDIFKLNTGYSVLEIAGFKLTLVQKIFPYPYDDTGSYSCIWVRGWEKRNILDEHMKGDN